MFKVIIVGVILTIVALFAMTMIDPSTKSGSDSTSTSYVSVNADGSQDVQIEGQVLHPGTYGMMADDTLEELIAKAGGVTEEADTDSYLPSLVIGERDYFYIPAKALEYCEPTEGEKININDTSWTVSTLKEALGVSTTLAQAILDYIAANGPFETLEELKEVKGIGEATYKQLRDKVVLK